MKPFLAIDLTTDKKNEQYNGVEFLVAKPSPHLVQALESSSEKADETIDQSKLPLAIRIGHWICGAVGAVLVVGISQALVGEDGVTLTQAYQNAAWMFWLAGGCLLAWLILKIVSTKKEKTVLESDESTYLFSNLESISNSIFADLGVPADAQEVDILSFYYKVKDGEVKVHEKGLQIVPYTNPVYRLFADDEHIYLANLEEKYAFPRSSLQAIRTVNKNIGVVEWNKEEAPNKGVYKPYKITVDQYDCIHLKPYHILEVTHGEELWGIYFPCYELPAFEAVTGIKAE